MTGLSIYAVNVEVVTDAEYESFMNNDSVSPLEKQSLAVNELFHCNTCHIHAFPNAELYESFANGNEYDYAICPHCFSVFEFDPDSETFRL